jgi:hypothetical protein
MTLRALTGQRTGEEGPQRGAGHHAQVMWRHSVLLQKVAAMGWAWSYGLDSPRSPTVVLGMARQQG